MNNTTLNELQVWKALITSFHQLACLYLEFHLAATQRWRCLSVYQRTTRHIETVRQTDRHTDIQTGLTEVTTDHSRPPTTGTGGSLMTSTATN